VETIFWKGATYRKTAILPFFKCVAYLSRFVVYLFDGSVFLANDIQRPRTLPCGTSSLIGWYSERKSLYRTAKLFCCRYDSVIAWMFCGNNILKSLGDTQKNCGALLPFFKCVAYPSRFASMVTCSMVPCFSRNPNWCIEMVLLVWRCCLIRFKRSSLNIFDRNGIRLIVILFVTASPLFCRCTWIVVNRF